MICRKIPTKVSGLSYRQSAVPVVNFYPVAKDAGCTGDKDNGILDKHWPLGLYKPCHGTGGAFAFMDYVTFRL